MQSRALLRIAMWSGPRNISTALMRAWGNRPDTAVVDEPFYAFYLQRTGADHPGAEEVIASGETNWRKVVDSLTAESCVPKRIFYQKQMTHHLLPEVGREWLRKVTNCFLIRDPADVIASYTKKNHEPAMEDLGFTELAEIYEFVCQETGATPPVIDSRDVQENPARTLRLLCDAVGVRFIDSMLSWPAGRRETDGIWAKHWYAEVEKSTAFQPPKREHCAVPERLRKVHERCGEIYRRLHAQRLH